LDWLSEGLGRLAWSSSGQRFEAGALPGAHQGAGRNADALRCGTQRDALRDQL